MAKIDLSKYGITGATDIVYNPSYELLFEEETKAGLETLKKSFVTPPPITKVAQGAGFKETVFTTEAFMKVFEERKGK